ncbi:conjugal transfer protein TrbC [Sphingobium sp. TB-6]|uniref:type-F conjugative transfer system pilin assembly protein TrbC n=1 Tax=Sphingobium sp. TB-6 TaxID=2728850 RepID=UPI00146E440F|nr:type-F conjugative transfer system pilin assembly protein TrbC [Sphingobium sp. TB-6]NML87693.1 conjugal transfer protein TrbC [Sphingobium sp. TB-6]
MPIWRRSIPSRALLAAAILVASPCQAQSEGDAGNARQRAQAQGDSALQHLKGAVAGEKDRAEARGPDRLPDLPEATRRRAFEGLRNRKPDPVMDARARSALTSGQDNLAAQREVMAKRLGQALGLEAPDITGLAGATPPSAQHGWVPLLFVSSSMPIPILRTYAAQLEKAGGVMAFRGVPGGMTKIGPMARLSAQVLRIDPGCDGPACAMRNVQLIVDPLVFRQHGVARVPALGLIPGDPTQPYCERDDNSPASRHIIFGDAALSGLLEEYARLGGTKEVADAQARLDRR